MAKNVLDEILEKSRQCLQSGELSEDGRERFHKRTKEHFNIIFGAMKEEVQRNSDLVFRFGEMTDKDREHEAIRMVSEHAGIEREISGRIDTEVLELVADVKKTIGLDILQDENTLEFADRAAYELADISKNDIIMTEKGLIEDQGLLAEKRFKLGIQKNASSTIDDILANAKLSNRKGIMERFQVPDRRPHVKAYSDLKRVQGYPVLHRLETVMEKLKTGKDKGEKLVPYMKQVFAKCYGAYDREIERNMNISIALSELNPKNDPDKAVAADLLHQRFKESEEFDKTITDAIMSVQPGIKRKLDIDLLDGHTPVEFMDALTIELKSYGRALERAERLLQTKEYDRLEEVDMPYMKDILTSAQTTIDYINDPEWKALSSHLSDTKDYKILDAYDVVVRKAPLSKIVEEEGMKQGRVAIPVFNPHKHAVEYVEMDAAFDSKNNAYYVSEADYNKLIASRDVAPVIPVLVQKDSTDKFRDLENRDLIFTQCGGRIDMTDRELHDFFTALATPGTPVNLAGEQYKKVHSYSKNTTLMESTIKGLRLRIKNTNYKLENLKRMDKERPKNENIAIQIEKTKEEIRIWTHIKDVGLNVQRNLSPSKKQIKEQTRTMRESAKSPAGKGPGRLDVDAFAAVIRKDNNRAGATHDNDHSHHTHRKSGPSDHDAL